MANSSEKNTGSADLFNHINLNGKGHSLKFSINNANAGSRLIFCRLKDSNIKNLVIDYSGTLNNFGKGSFAYGIDKSVMTDCYFNYNVNTVGSDTNSKGSGVANFVQYSTFNNCIFDLQCTAADSTGLVIISGTSNSASSTFNNSTVIYSKEAAELQGLFLQTGVTHTFNNTSISKTTKEFTADSGNYEKYDTTVWTINALGIKLCGKDIVIITT